MRVRCSPTATCAVFLLVCVIACGGKADGDMRPDAGDSLDATADVGGGSDSSAPAQDTGPVDAGNAPDTPSDSSAAVDAGDAIADASIDVVDAAFEASVSCQPPAPADAGPPIVVSGWIVDGFGAPASVAITIQGTTTSTASDGSFHIAGVTPPYDVLIDWPGDTLLVAYVGLTRPDPTLVALQVGVGNAAYGRVEGTVTSPVDAGLLGVFLDSTGAPAGGVDEGASPVGGSSYAFSVDAFWGAGNSAPSTLWGFSGTLSPTGGLAAITGVASQSVTVPRSGDVTGVSLALAPPGATAATLSGTVTMPAGYALTEVDLGMSHGNYFGTPLTDEVVAAGVTSFAYATFTGGPTWTLSARANIASTVETAYRTGLAGNEALTIDLPACDTTYLSPAPSASLPGPCVDLAWSSTPSTLYVASIYGPSLNYMVVTGQASVRVPYALPPGMYSWSVRTIMGVTGIDALSTNFSTAAMVSSADWAFMVDHVECSSSTLDSFEVQ